MTLPELLEQMQTLDNKEHRRKVCELNHLGHYVGYLPKQNKNGTWEIMTVGSHGYVRQTYDGNWGNIEVAGTFHY